MTDQLEKDEKRRAMLLQKAEFDPRLKKYILNIGTFSFLITIVGILLLPFWLILGRKYIERYYENLDCVLTTRALQFKKGVWFHRERTIPLDKIQDLTFREGPLLKKMGLSSLKIETAGQASESADLSLLGVIDAYEFRAKVLDQRDAVTDNRFGVDSQSENESKNQTAELLKEISKTLKSIESKLDNR